MSSTSALDQRREAFNKKKNNLNAVMIFKESPARRPSLKIQAALKGKTKAEQKKLLAELESSKQKEFQLIYEAEHDKMVQEGKWAVKNVAEKFHAEARLQELEDEVEINFLKNIKQTNMFHPNKQELDQEINFNLTP